MVRPLRWRYMLWEAKANWVYLMQWLINLLIVICLFFMLRLVKRAIFLIDHKFVSPLLELCWRLPMVIEPAFISNVLVLFDLGGEAVKRGFVVVHSAFCWSDWLLWLNLKCNYTGLVSLYGVCLPLQRTFGRDLASVVGCFSALRDGLLPLDHLLSFLIDMLWWIVQSC